MYVDTSLFLYVTYAHVAKNKYQFMNELLFLLLPFAFLSGWMTARKRYRKSENKSHQLSHNFVHGINLLLDEKPDKALEVFLNHPDIDEYTAETYLLIGNMFRNRGEVDRALKVHQNLIGRSNLHPARKKSAMLAYGEDFLVAGMLDRAERVFTEVMENSDNDPKACAALRIIYEQLQQWDRAIDVTQCVAKNTNEDLGRYIAHYYCELAQIELDKGNVHLVEQMIESAKKADKHSSRVLVIQGDLSTRKKLPAEALKYYQTAIRQDSRLLGLLNGRLQVVTDGIGKDEKLKKFLMKVIDKSGDIQVLNYLIDVLSRNAITSKDIEYIEDTFRSGTSSPATLQRLVEIWKEHTTDQEKIAQFDLITGVLQEYLQDRSDFQCQDCGYQMKEFIWRCPACQEWDTVSQIK